MIVNATRSTTQIQQHAVSFIPSTYLMNNYKILTGKSFNPMAGFKNSIIISVCTTALATYFSTLTAYAVVVYEWKLRKPFFSFVMSIMMIPGTVTMIGFYQMVYKIGMTNKLSMLIIGAVASPSVVFFMRQYMIPALPLEIVLTAFMVIVILACNDQRIVNKPGKGLFPLVLALYITFAVTFSGPYSGACFNMARDFGPRLFALIWGAANGYDISGIFGAPCDFLIYLFIPTLGAVFGAFIYDGAIARLLPQPKVQVDVKGVINENYIKKGSIIKARKAKDKKVVTSKKKK